MEKISWTDHVRNEVLLRVNEQRNILHEIRKGKANWIGHILLRNCLLKQVIERKIKEAIEVIRRRGRRRKKLLDNLKDRRGYSHLKEEALDRTRWRNRFGRSFGPVVRRITDECILALFVLILVSVSVYSTHGTAITDYDTKSSPCISLNVYCIRRERKIITCKLFVLLGFIFFIVFHFFVIDISCFEEVCKV